MLEAHTVHSVKRWVGHPSIPKRVFGPAEYLVNPPKQPTQMGSFKATRSQCGGRDLKSKEQSLSAKFAAWFNTAFAALTHKAILASQEAATVCLMKAQHSQEGSTGVLNPMDLRLPMDVSPPG